MKFGQMLVNGGELNGVRILRPETVKAMTRDQVRCVVGPLALLLSDDDILRVKERVFAWRGAVINDWCAVRIVCVQGFWVGLCYILGPLLGGFGWVCVCAGWVGGWMDKWMDSSKWQSQTLTHIHVYTHASICHAVDH